MADDTDSLVSGLKADVDQHMAGQQAPAPEADDGIVSGLKADVDAHLSGKANVGTEVQGPKKKPSIDLSKLPFAQKVMHWESGGDANAKSPSSSATGAGQFIDSTWLPVVRKHRPDLAGKSDAELLAMRNDPALSEQMIDAHGADNAEKLKSAGIPVSDASKYGAHWFGADKFAQIAKADPKTPIEKLIGKDAAASNGLSGKTADDVKTMTANRMGGDYMPQDQSWGDTLSQAGSNLLPSVGHAAAGIASAVMHPMDTAGTLGKIGIGLKSKIDGWAGNPQDEKKKAEDESLVDAMGHSYKEKYGTLDGFKQYLAHDPAGVLMDASTVLTGGGGAAAKIPGIAGKAGELVGAVGKAVNPLNPLGAVSKTVKAVTSPAAVLDGASNVVPKVDALIKKVTNNTMSGADLVDPTVKTAFADAVQKKGVSEASVREALLKSLGLKAPTSVTTGMATPTSALPEVNKAIGENNTALSARAAKIGTPASPSSLGEALENAHTSSMNAASAAYDKIRTMPGTFGKQMPELPEFGKIIKQKFDKSGIPTADLKTIAQTGHPQAAKAIALIKTTWGSGKTLLRQDVNSSEILTMRKALNNMRGSATGSDVKAMGDVIDAFDEHIADLSKRGFYTDARGNPVKDVGKQIQAANAAYRTHFNTFETPNGANNAIVNTVKKLKTGQGRSATGDLMPSGDTDLQTHAQAALGKDLMHPTKGGSTYNQVAKALGTTAPLDEHIKGALMNPDTPNASAMLNSPVAAKAFAGAPDDLARARHLHAASAINNSKIPLDAKISRSMKENLGRTAWKGIASLAGEHFGGLPGAIIGPSVIEPMMEHMGERSVLKKAMAGAPNTSGAVMRAIKKSAQRISSPAGIASAHYTNEAENQPAIARASGGKVDDDALVGRLIHRWRQAKRATNETTKPLLDVHDNVIAKALNIAQEHI